MREIKNDQDRLRNPLTVRWADEEHKRVVDTAWRNRTTASALIRELVLNNLEPRQDLIAETKTG